MSKKRKPQVFLSPDPSFTPDPVFTPADASEFDAQSTDAQDIVTQRIVALSSPEKQLRAINEMESRGFRHYESFPIGGNQIVLRFRRQ
jgi:hypothetical protein